MKNKKSSVSQTFKLLFTVFFTRRHKCSLIISVYLRIHYYVSSTSAEECTRDCLWNHSDLVPYSRLLFPCAGWSHGIIWGLSYRYNHCELVHPLPQCPVRHCVAHLPAIWSSSGWVEVSEWHADFSLWR